MTEAASKDSLLKLIRAVRTNNVSTALQALQTVALKTRGALSTLSRNDMIDVQQAFSAAFKPLNVKPAWATALCRDMDRAIMAMGVTKPSPDALPPMPLSECLPRLFTQISAR